MKRSKHDWKEADALTDAEIHAAARAYLTVIAREPEIVRRALKRTPP